MDTKFEESGIRTIPVMAAEKTVKLWRKEEFYDLDPLHGKSIGS
jgi:hypothetical protein